MEQVGVVVRVADEDVVVAVGVHVADTGQEARRSRSQTGEDHARAPRPAVAAEDQARRRAVAVDEVGLAVVVDVAQRSDLGGGVGAGEGRRRTGQGQRLLRAGSQCGRTSEEINSAGCGNGIVVELVAVYVAHTRDALAAGQRQCRRRLGGGVLRRGPGVDMAEHQVGLAAVHQEHVGLAVAVHIARRAHLGQAGQGEDRAKNIGLVVEDDVAGARRQALTKNQVGPPVHRVAHQQVE